jgi:diguanylate cyclase (GGDEF)-like protein
MICRATRQNTGFAVLYIDLDNFKSINDQFGHDAGDHMLKEVSRLLISIVRDSDTVARIGGDEFILLIESIHDHDEPTLVAKRILDELNQNLKFHPDAKIIGASIGISIYPQDGKEASSLINAADHAMYQAKKIRNTYRYYTHPLIPH